MFKSIRGIRSVIGSAYVGCCKNCFESEDVVQYTLQDNRQKNGQKSGISKSDTISQQKYGT